MPVGIRQHGVLIWVHVPAEEPACAAEDDEPYFRRGHRVKLACNCCSCSTLAHFVPSPRVGPTAIATSAVRYFFDGLLCHFPLRKTRAGNTVREHERDLGKDAGTYCYDLSGL